MPDTTPTLRDRIAEALAAHDGLTWGPGRSSQPSGVIEDYHHRADAVLAVLRRATQPEIKAATVPARLVLGTTDQQPAPVNRATVLREAADRYAKLADQNETYDREHGELDDAARLTHGAVRDVAAGLRRMADEAQQPEVAHVVTDDSDDPEHVDDCPGCETFSLTGHRLAEAQQPETEACKCGHPKERHNLLGGTYAHCRWAYSKTANGRCFCGMYRPAP